MGMFQAPSTEHAAYMVGVSEERTRVLKVLDEKIFHDIRLAPAGEHTETCRGCILTAIVKGGK